MWEESPYTPIAVILWIQGDFFPVEKKKNFFFILFCIRYMSGTVLSAFHVLSNLILKQPLDLHEYSCYTNDET